MNELDRGTMSATNPSRPSWQRGGTMLAVLAFAAVGIGACSSSASAVPSIAVPSIAVPSDILPGASGSPVAGCVDATTMAVIDQVRAPGADVPALLASNKDALIAGLTTLQPADAATTRWRDTLLKALQDGDMTTAATQVDALVSGGVSLSAC